MDLQNRNEAHASTLHDMEEYSEAAPGSPRHNSVSTETSIQTHPRSNNGRNKDTSTGLQYRPHAPNEHTPSFPPTTHYRSYSLPLLEQSILLCFTDWHGKTARPWQLKACGDVLTRHTPRIINAPSLLRPILLVRSTGGGKSAVRDVAGILCGGITITIVPLLSLAADQTAKLSQLSLSQGLGRRLQVFNLDVLRSEKLNRALRNHLEGLKNDASSNKRVFLFSSPQKITNDPLWQQTIAACCRNGTLRLLSVDECHLYASHGMEFRAEFGQLRKCLFRTILRETKHPIPILFMTATASQSMVNDLSALTGLSFDLQRDLIWPSSHSGVQRRNVFINLSFKESPIRRIKSDLLTISRSNKGQKLIVYSNSRKALINLFTKSRLALNHHGIQKDLLLVHGTMFREQKFHNTEMFVGQPLLDECPTTGRELRFDPIALFATAGTTSSGIDCSDVNHVIFHGFPATIEDFLQCMGRCGRSSHASPSNSSFTVVVSLNSLVALMTRIFVIPKYEASQNKNNTNQPSDVHSQEQSKQSAATVPISYDDLSQRQWRNLLPVLSLLCLSNGQCLHCQLESKMLHPFRPAVCDIGRKCNNACWQCSTSSLSTPLDGKVDKNALKAYFVEIFITRKLESEKRSLRKDCFLDQLLQFETFDTAGEPEKIFAKRVFHLKNQRSAKQRTKALWKRVSLSLLSALSFLKMASQLRSG